MLTVIERVLEYLTLLDNGTTISVGAIDEAIPGLTRRQITTALHGLADGGLRGQLEHVGKGLWRYQPGVPLHIDYHIEDTGLIDVPIGWKGEFEIILSIETAHGQEYLARTRSGTLLRLIPILRAQGAIAAMLTPIPPNSPTTPREGHP